MTGMLVRRGLVLLLCGAAGAVSCQRTPCPPGTRGEWVAGGEGRVVACEVPESRAAIWIEIADDGRKRRECRVNDGVADGPFTAWHEDGSMWIEGYFVNGVRDGHWTEWDLHHVKAAEGDYRRGTLIAGAPAGLAARCEPKKRGSTPSAR